jgi:hypothetical protein
MLEGACEPRFESVPQPLLFFLEQPRPGRIVRNNLNDGLTIAHSNESIQKRCMIVRDFLEESR